ncbi:MAG: hypothetical protein ACHQQS_02030 [Thermoanaerobaculales bacterium]|jgi:hypothetical protein
MRRLIILATVLLAAQTQAEKPWEQRVDTAVPVPIVLPAIPPTSPFAIAVVSPPAPNSTPLREKFADLFSVEVAAYIDAQGACRRAVFTRLPWPGLGTELQEGLLETRFTPARAHGGDVPVWLPLGIDLKGRIDEGRVVHLDGAAPDPTAPPVAEAPSAPVPDPRDLALPATSLDSVEKLPTPKRFRARLDGHTWRQPVKLLVAVSAEGHAERVVFLSWPDGLRKWLLTSMAGWLFRPAANATGPAPSWVELNGEVEVRLGDLRADAVRVTRQACYPRASAAPADARPPAE